MALLDLKFLSKAQQVRIGSLRARHKVREDYRRRQLLERAQLPRGFRRLVQYQVQFAESHLLVLLRDGQLSLRAGHFEVGLENFQLRHFTGLESRLCDLADAPRQIQRALLLRREGPRAGCRVIGLAASAADWAGQGLDFDAAQEIFLPREFDAAPALSADFHRLVEEEAFVRGVAQRGEVKRGVGNLAGNTNPGLRNCAAKARRSEIQILPAGTVERVAQRQCDWRRRGNLLRRRLLRKGSHRQQQTERREDSQDHSPFTKDTPPARATFQVSPANGRERYADAGIIACQKRRSRASSGTQDRTGEVSLRNVVRLPAVDIKGVNCRYLTSVVINVSCLRARQAERPNWA